MGRVSEQSGFAWFHVERYSLERWWHFDRCTLQSIRGVSRPYCFFPSLSPPPPPPPPLPRRSRVARNNSNKSVTGWHRCGSSADFFPFFLSLSFLLFLFFFIFQIDQITDRWNLNSCRLTRRTRGPRCPIWYLSVPPLPPLPATIISLVGLSRISRCWIFKRIRGIRDIVQPQTRESARFNALRRWIARIWKTPVQRELFSQRSVRHWFHY